MQDRQGGQPVIDYATPPPAPAAQPWWYPLWLVFGWSLVAVFVGIPLLILLAWLIAVLLL